MFQNIDLKLVFSVMASVLVIIAYYPYIRDIFLNKTKPHIYTWLIWGITSGVATFGLWQGGGGASVVSMTIIFLLVLFVFVLSFKYGTKSITKSDTVILILALGSVVVWWGLDNPVLAVAMASLIDVFGYLPTYRKSWSNPYEETILFWALIAVASVLTIAAISEYNLLTTPYIVAMATADFILMAILISRRKIINKNN